MDKNGGKIKAVLVNLDKPICGYHASESDVKPDRQWDSRSETKQETATVDNKNFHNRNVAGLLLICF